MLASLNNKLDQLSREYYISYGSFEQRKIDASVAALKKRLKLHFGNDAINVIEFGSYKRDTILPRRYDEHSDVDLMIVFDHEALKLRPGTYRTRLVAFAAKWYSMSEVYKTAPTVTLELDHIKYDLVPAYEESSFLSSSKNFFIPKDDNLWMITDPNGFNLQLTRVNTSNHNFVKKVIRLLKAWNAKFDYPIQSFELEKEIAAMNFWLLDPSLQSYFFRAIENLSQYRNGVFFLPHQKIVSLKENAIKVKSCLKSNDLVRANSWLSHILPT
jgi:predicted nucleotidyltransferase